FFGLLALVPFLWTRRRTYTWSHLVLGATVAIAVYAPWVGFQHFYAPPGDRLLKWHFAGTDIDRPDPRPVLQAIMDSYRSAGPQRMVAAKLANIRLLAGDPTIWSNYRGHWTPGWSTGAGILREVLLTQGGPSAGILLLGLPLLVLRR